MGQVGGLDISPLEQWGGALQSGFGMEGRDCAVTEERSMFSGSALCIGFYHANPLSSPSLV